MSPAQIRRCELRAGDEVTGPVRPPRRSERYPSLVRVDSVNGSNPEPPAERARFEHLTPVFASERLPAPEGLDAAPFGKGSRVAIAGPPGAGAHARMLRKIVGTLAESQPDSLRSSCSRACVPRRSPSAPRRRRDRRRRRLRRLRRGAGSDRRDGHRAREAASRARRHAVVVIDSLDGLPAGARRRVFGAGRAAEEGGSLTVIAVVGDEPEPLRWATTRVVLGGDGEAGPRSPAPFARDLLT